MKNKILELELIPNSSTVGKATPGTIKIYTNSAGSLRQIDEAGNDLEVANNPDTAPASITLEAGGTIPSSSGYVQVSGITANGVKEKFTLGILGAIDASDYFTFYAPGDLVFYNMWYSVNGAGAAPGLGGTEIEIALSTAESTDLDDISNITIAALTALNIGITIFSFQDAGNLYLYPEQGAVGPCTDAEAGGTSGIYIVQINNQGAYPGGAYKTVTSATAIAPGLRIGQRLVLELVTGDVVLAPGTLVDPGIPSISERIWNGSSWLLL